LYVKDSSVIATAQRVNVQDDPQVPFQPESAEPVLLADMDAVWIRTDPPVDRAYFYMTMLLDLLPAHVKVVNRPSTIRDWNEKLAALQYPQFIPATMVARHSAQIIDFVHQHGRTTLKPIDGHGGAGIIFVDAEQADLESQIRLVTHGDSHWVIVQQYLDAAKEGDKRILLLNGEPLGAILRLHAEGVELNNLDQGGEALASKLLDRDREICAGLKADLVSRGVVFAGIDVIGGMLIEINITSPTGLQEMSRHDNRSYHKEIMASLE
jgi:glutathione synthase